MQSLMKPFWKKLKNICRYNMECQLSVILSLAMTIYTISSIYYLVVTQWMGTPFKDSLTEKQKEIKQRSANQRKTIFVQGVILSLGPYFSRQTLFHLLIFKNIVPFFTFLSVRVLRRLSRTFTVIFFRIFPKLRGSNFEISMRIRFIPKHLIH